MFLHCCFIIISVVIPFSADIQEKISYLHYWSLPASIFWRAQLFPGVFFFKRIKGSKEGIGDRAREQGWRKKESGEGGKRKTFDILVAQISLHWEILWTYKFGFYADSNCKNPAVSYFHLHLPEICLQICIGLTEIAELF